MIVEMYNLNCLISRQALMIRIVCRMFAAMPVSQVLSPWCYALEMRRLVKSRAIIHSSKTRRLPVALIPS